MAVGGGGGRGCTTSSNRAPRAPSNHKPFRPNPCCNPACAPAPGRTAAGRGEPPCHAQPRAARLAGRLRRGGRPAARRRGLRRCRGPVRAHGGQSAVPVLGPAVLLPAADGPVHRRAHRRARPPALLPGGRPGARRHARPAGVPAGARQAPARAGPPLAGRRRAADVPHRGVDGGDRLRLRRAALRDRLRRAGGHRLRRLHAVGRDRAGRGPRHRVRRGAAGRGAGARARRHAA